MSREGAAVQGGRAWANVTIAGPGGRCVGCGGELEVGKLALLWQRQIGHYGCVARRAARRMMVGGTIMPNPDAVAIGGLWTPPALIRRLLH